MPRDPQKLSATPLHQAHYSGIPKLTSFFHWKKKINFLLKSSEWCLLTRISHCTHSSSIRASKNIKEARWSWSWSLQRFWPFLKLRMLVSILVMGWQQPPALLLALHVDCARQGVVSRFLDGLNRKIPKLLTDFSLTFLVPLVDRKTKKKKKKKTQTWIQVRELLLKLAWTPSST